jgi:mycothiol system anti-sigma-R factor
MTSDTPPSGADDPFGSELRSRAGACGTECQEALAELERFLDGELTTEQVGRVSQHLSDCYPCTDRATFEEQLRALVRRGCVDSAPEGLLDRVRVRLDAGGIPEV